MTPTEVVDQQQRSLLAVLDELELTADPIERTRLIGLAAVRSKAQAALKEELLYPLLRPQAGAAVEEALAAQRAIDLVLDEAVGTPSAANVAVLRDLITRLFAHEVERLLARLDALPAAESAALGERLQAATRAAEDEVAAEI